MGAHHAVNAVLGGPGIEVRETHGSWVFMHAQDVYKVKKPVRFPFLDYSTLALRRTACEQELEVNRRTSPEIYLGLLAIVEDPQGEAAVRAEPRADERVVEWVVHMRRLPDALGADVRLQAGTLGIAETRHTAEYLAQFHGSTAVMPAARARTTLDALWNNAVENLDSLQIFARQRLGPEGAQELRHNHLHTLRELIPVLARRAAEGRVVDGHGDFRLEHVYLDDQGTVTVLDALEFNPAFRIADVCADVASLVMDLRVRGRADLAEVFLASYTHVSGDHDLYRIIDFYTTYWALVRAKVQANRADQLAGHTESASQALESSASRLELATHIARGTARGGMVVAITGLIACGKSRVAAALSDRLAAPVLSSDRIRKQLAHVDFTDNLGEEAFAGAYAPTVTDAVYVELLRRAEIILDTGRPVVLDASFQHEQARWRLRQLATDRNIPYLFVECHAPRAAIHARLQRRTGRLTDSDARPSLLPRFESQYPPWDQEDPNHHLSVDTTGPKEEVDATVLEHVRSLRRRGPRDPEASARPS